MKHFKHRGRHVWKDIMDKGKSIDGEIEYWENTFKKGSRIQTIRKAKYCSKCGEQYDHLYVVWRVD